MGYEEIKADWESLNGVYNNIESARNSIAALSLTLSEWQSTWEPLDMMRERAHELEELIVAYEEFLQKDSRKLQKAANALKEQDEKSSRKFNERESDGSAGGGGGGSF